MTPASLARLVALSAVWGAAFLFIRIAAPVFGPVLLIELRVAIAGLALLAYAGMLGVGLALGERLRLYFALGALNSAAPFVLIAYAELRLEASLAAVLIATAPLFGAMLAHAIGEERISARKLAGMATGVAGVAILVGWTPVERTAADWTAVVAVLGAAIFYACAAAYARRCARRTSAAPPLALAAGSQLGAAVLLLPLVPGTWPGVMPDAEAIACALALALLSSALAFVLYFRLIADVGPVKTLTVNFLAPVFGVACGVAVLDEPLTASMVAGTAVILTGSWLVLDLRPR